MLTTMDCTLECFRGLAECLEGSKEMGVICVLKEFMNVEKYSSPYIQ